MNIDRQETRTKKAADRLHEQAQNTGDASAYIRAAQLYEDCGAYEQARICREAAARLTG